MEFPEFLITVILALLLCIDFISVKYLSHDQNTNGWTVMDKFNTGSKKCVGEGNGGQVTITCERRTGLIASIHKPNYENTNPVTSMVYSLYKICEP